MGKGFSLCRAVVAATLLVGLSSAPRALSAQGCAGVSATGTVAPGRDTVCLTLDQALARAMGQNHEVRTARLGVQRAEAEIRSLLATAYPRIDGNVTFTRTFDSPFRMTGGGGDSTSGFDPDTLAPLADRIRYLEKTPNLDFGSLFGSLPFGQENAYSFTITGSQTLYNGGKFRAIYRLRDTYRDQAQLALDEASAATEQGVRVAYIRTQLAHALVEIAEASLTQAADVLRQVRLQHENGKVSDLDVLRAEVALDNLQPQAVQARSAAELADLDLKRLLDLPTELPLHLGTALVAPSETALTQLPADAAATVRDRPLVMNQRRQVDLAADQIIVARAAHRPQLNLRMSYGRQIYPDGLFGFGGQTWRTDWTGSLVLSVPIFAGGTASADISRARLAHELEQVRLEQVIAGASLEYQQALGDRDRAASTITARQRTVEQAQRVHDLTVLRFESGMATQLEIADARLALLQARTHLAQATADLLIADATVARTLGLSSITRSAPR